MKRYSRGHKMICCVTKREKRTICYHGKNELPGFLARKNPKETAKNSDEIMFKKVDTVQ